MRYFKLALLILFSHQLLSQSVRYYRLSQRYVPAPGTGLVIRNDRAILKQLPKITGFRGVTAVKLQGFNKPGTPSADSVLALVAPVITPTLLIFEDCDLTETDQVLQHFNAVTEIVLNRSQIIDNAFFYSLRNSPLKKIQLIGMGEDLMTDSLHVLKDLESVEFSDKPFSDLRPNLEELYVTKNGRTVKAGYYGIYGTVSAAVKQNAPTTRQMGTISAADISMVSPRCVRPPISGMKIGDTLFALMPGNREGFKYRSGSVVNVDPDGFLTAKGAPYNGEIKIFYREFRDPVDIMLSGIPMTNIEGGEQQIFRSGGMYEIYAFDREGKPLTAKHDSCARIDFAMTDTSSSFGFFSLNNDGSWTQKRLAVQRTAPSPTVSPQRQMPEPVRRYFNLLSQLKSTNADTTRFLNRFDRMEYLGRSRKDNLHSRKDSVRFWGRKWGYSLKGYVKVKYAGKTKDKRILYKLTQIARGPAYMVPATGQLMVYAGPLSKEEFKKTYCRKYYWDLRNVSAGNMVTLKLKSAKEIVEISGEPVTLLDSNKIAVRSRAGISINRRISRALHNEARKFDRKARLKPADDNELNVSRLDGQEGNEKRAMDSVRRFMSDEEKKLNLEKWRMYAFSFRVSDTWEERMNNQVGRVLLSSGMGIQNIDEYIHKKLCEPVTVEFLAQTGDTATAIMNVVLYESINTSYPLNGQDVLSGYFFKGKPNTVIRLMSDGYMQVIPDKALADYRSRGKYRIPVQKQYDVRGLNGDQIRSLILSPGRSRIIACAVSRPTADAVESLFL